MAEELCDTEAPVVDAEAAEALRLGEPLEDAPEDALADALEDAAAGNAANEEHLVIVLLFCGLAVENSISHRMSFRRP